MLSTSGDISFNSDLPPFGGEITASSDKRNFGAMRAQADSRCLCSNRSTELNHIQCLLDMQFSGNPFGVNLPIVVHTIAHVGLLLNLTEHLSGSNRVRCSRRHKKGVSRL